MARRDAPLGPKVKFSRKQAWVIADALCAAYLTPDGEGALSKVVAIDIRGGGTVQLTDGQSRAVSDALSIAPPSPAVEAASTRLRFAGTKRPRRPHVRAPEDRQGALANPAASRKGKRARHMTGGSP